MKVNPVILSLLLSNGCIVDGTRKLEVRDSANTSSAQDDRDSGEDARGTDNDIVTLRAEVRSVPRGKDAPQPVAEMPFSAEPLSRALHAEIRQVEFQVDDLRNRILQIHPEVLTGNAHPDAAGTAETRP